MIRVVNRHGAFCHGLQPGAEGEVDENNVGVKSALAGKLLERVLAIPSGDGSGPSLFEDVRLSEALGTAEARIATLEAERGEMASEIERRDGAIAARDERIAALDAENAQLKLDLEAATAPAKSKASADFTADPAEAHLTTDGRKRRNG